MLVYGVKWKNENNSLQHLEIFESLFRNDFALAIKHKKRVLFVEVVLTSDTRTCNAQSLINLFVTAFQIELQGLFS